MAPFFLAHVSTCWVFFNTSMDDSTFDSFLEKIRSDDTLRKTLMEAMQPVASGSRGNTDHSSELAAEDPPVTGDNTSSVADVHRSDDSSMVADEHQSRGINRREADVLPLSVNPLAANEEGKPEEDSSLVRKLLDSSVAFDPTAVAPSDELMFDTHQVITNYLEQHFRSSLNKDVRNSMHKTHPVPRTPVMKVPKVDCFMADHLKERLPKSCDSELGTIQSALLSAASPLMCLWSDLLDNNLLADENATINAHDVLNVVQRTLVLMGNANELLSQTRRRQILQCVDKSLEKYGKDPRPNSQEYLFGEEFCSQLKSKVESNTQVVSLSKRYHPYGERPRDSRQSTLGRSKQQFFRRSPAGKGGSRQGQFQSTNKFQPKKGPNAQYNSQNLSTFNPSGKSGKR